VDCPLKKTAPDFGREVCGDLAAACSREWLVVNGIGGFASGTIAGALTRRYHGLLVAALAPPLGRTLLVSKVEEVVQYQGCSYPLGCNRWQSGLVSPEGYRYIERFRLEGTTPVWTFALADALLEKRIFMRRGENTTYVLYRLLRGSAPLRITIKALINYRDYHGETRDGWTMRVETVSQRSGAATGIRVGAFDGARPCYLLSSGAAAAVRNDWYRDYSLALEKERGFAGVEHHLCAGEFTAVIPPGGSLSLVATTEEDAELDGERVYLERRRDEQALLARARASSEVPLVKQLVLAADQFVVSRPGAADLDGSTVIAGYPWFGDWGRDTMISLAGLTLWTGRPDRARSILRTFARFVDRGMLPNRFPDSGSVPEYNTADATLLYFEALAAYFAATGDETLLADLYPLLKDIIRWHLSGTRHGIRVDAADGLLCAGEPGVQVTWMDAKVGDWVVTPRIGKPVEVNALWYNALCTLADFADRLGQDGDGKNYRAQAAEVSQSFGRFMNPATGYCFDVLDGPAGNDPSLRPNQILAVSLTHTPLAKSQSKAVVDACALHLLTSHGLRSLAPFEREYVGICNGDVRQRDSAYHQGTVWSWLIGPFALAHHRVYGDAEQARSYLLPLLHHLSAAGLGSISEIFDGDPPHAPRGCIAQAWSVAEWLRAYLLLSPSSDKR